MTPRAKKRSLWDRVAEHLDPKQLAAMLVALIGIATSQQQGAKLNARSGNTDAQVVALSGAVMKLEARVDSLTVALHTATQRAPRRTTSAEPDDALHAARPRRTLAGFLWGAITAPLRVIGVGGNG